MQILSQFSRSAPVWRIRILRRRLSLAWAGSPLLQAVGTGALLFPLAYGALWLLLALLA
jgi:hypothetical protein